MDVPDAIIATQTLNNNNFSDFFSFCTDVGCPTDITMANNINSDPLFASGPSGDYYLSQTASGQASNSPCLDTGDDTAVNLGLDTLTTRTDQATDGGTVDMGFHYTPASATEFYVPTDYATIQAALTAVSGGSTIIVLDGTYIGTGNKNLDFGGKAITLRSQNGPDNCTIDCQGNGSGLVFSGGETATSVVDGFTITNGNATNGGGLNISGSSPTVKNCVIDGNTASFGGGISLSNSSAALTNLTIVGNTGISGGGGLYFSNSNSAVVHCTIGDNTSANGGGIACQGASPTVTNSILWGDSAASGPEIFLASTSSLTVAGSDVEGGQAAASVDGTSTLSWGTGNIDADPLFAGVGDYHLTGISPCLDTVPDAGVSIDIDGDTRPFGASYDMGSDEFVGNFFYVPGDYATIEAAIDGVPEGAIIIVRDGMYTGAGNRNLNFGGKAILLRSENGPDYCYIDCEAYEPAFTFNSGETATSILDGFTIRNAIGTNGAGIHCTDASPTIRNCIIDGNSAQHGAGIFLWNSSAGLTNCTISRNTSYGFGGGIVCVNSNPDIKHCTIADNTAGYGGGILSLASSPTMINGIVWANSAAAGSEILLANSSSMTVSYTDVRGGQGLAYVQPGSALTWGPGNIDVDPVFELGIGDFHLEGASPCIDAGTDAGVYTDMDGDLRPNSIGFDMGSDEFFGSTYYVPDDYASLQDALDGARDGDVVIARDDTYYENINFNGRAIRLISENGPAGCVIDAQNLGRAVVFEGGEPATTVLDGFTIINGNDASAFTGGAIYVANSSPTIRNCVIRSSTAKWGAGVCLFSSSSEITNCVIAGNSSDIAAAGVLCYNFTGSFTHCTIAYNAAAFGGGIVCFISSMTMTNCIVWGNVGGGAPGIALTNGSVLNIGYSDAEGGQTGVYATPGCTLNWGAGNIDVHPLFAGDTAYHLTGSSPCIDAGTDAEVDTDIDGEARPNGLGYDIGSDEYY